MSAYDTPGTICPNCQQQADAEYVDIGIGMQRCSPFHCYGCGSTEMDWRYEYTNASEKEKKLGWVIPSEHPDDFKYEFVEAGDPLNIDIEL